MHYDGVPIQGVHTATVPLTTGIVEQGTLITRDTRNLTLGGAIFATPVVESSQHACRRCALISLLNNDAKLNNLVLPPILIPLQRQYEGCYIGVTIDKKHHYVGKNNCNMFMSLKMCTYAFVSRWKHYYVSFWCSLFDSKIKNNSSVFFPIILQLHFPPQCTIAFIGNFAQIPRESFTRVAQMRIIVIIQSAKGGLPKYKQSSVLRTRSKYTQMTHSIH